MVEITTELLTHLKRISSRLDELFRLQVDTSRRIGVDHEIIERLVKKWDEGSEHERMLFQRLHARIPKETV